MATPLIELDNFYKTTIYKLTVNARLTYCRNNVDLVQSVLLKQANLLDKQQKKQLREILEATQNEIKQLSNTT